MGCNYYLRTNQCACCGRYDEMHIGKHSYGWRFHFRGYLEDETNGTELLTWSDWKEHLKTGEIYDEYGDSISYEDFVKIVESTKDGKIELYNDDCKDPDGFPFTYHDFS